LHCGGLGMRLGPRAGACGQARLCGGGARRGALWAGACAAPDGGRLTADG